MRWLAGQKETPSFASQLRDNLSSILDAPLPRSLQVDSPPANQARRSFSPTISHRRDDSFKTPRSARVYDSLIEKGKLMMLNKEALREQALANELKTLKQKPQVTEMAKAIPPRQEPIEDRLLRKANEASQKQTYDMEMKRQQRQKELQVTATFHPTISSRGKRAESKVMTEDYYQNWHRRREQRLEARRTENMLREISDLRDGPDINPRSQRLAAAKREKEGLSGLSHAEMMMERDRLTKLASWERGQRELEDMANPQITVFAATLPREGTAYDRLYAASFDAEERRVQRLREHLQAESSRASFSPRISRLAAATPRALSVEDEIMQRHLEAQAIRDERARLELEREKDLHHPAINPVSDAIASRLPTSTKERLSMPKTQHYDPAEHSATRSRASSVRSASVATTASVASAALAERLESMAHFEERREANLKRLKEEQLERELEGCTFAPAVTSRASITQGSVHERNQQWERRREMKLDEQRRAREDSETRDCTFAPSRRHDAQNSAGRSNEDNTVYGGDGKPWGSQEFISRMEAARRRKTERELLTTPRTDNWSPSLTVPKEFHLGRTKTPVKSLSRPVQSHVPLSSPPPRPARSESASASSSVYGGAIVPPSLWH